MNSGRKCICLNHHHQWPLKSKCNSWTFRFGSNRDLQHCVTNSCLNSHRVTVIPVLTKTIKPFKARNHVFMTAFKLFDKVTKLCWPHSNWPIGRCWNKQPVFHLKVKVHSPRKIHPVLNRRILGLFIFAQLDNNWCWEVTLNPDIFWEVRD